MTREDRVKVAHNVMAELNVGGFETEDGYYTFSSETAGVKLMKTTPVPYFIGKDIVPTSANVRIVNDNTISVAFLLAKAGKTGVLNFASAWQPGGGWLRGDNAQEECLARCSTLYRSIGMNPAASGYYLHQKTHLCPYNPDLMLVSPRVTVYRFPDDGSHMYMPFDVCCISCAAVDYRKHAGRDDPRVETGNIKMRMRIQAILNQFYLEGCRNVVLGAWGCGVFKNKPLTIAQLFRTEIYKGGWIHAFDNITFAILGDSKGTNVKAFEQVFGMTAVT